MELLGEKTLPQTAHDKLIKYCPSMDLVALGSTDQQVLIYRLNGQRVYGATQKGGKLRVESVCWKPNGMLGHGEGPCNREANIISRPAPCDSME